MACRLAGFRLDACLRHLDLMGVFIYILNELLLFTGEECCWPTTVGFIKQPDYSLCFPAMDGSLILSVPPGLLASYRYSSWKQ